MPQRINDKSSSKQNRRSQSPSNSQSMKEINSQKLKKLGKCFNIVDSPQIVFDLCDKAYTKSRQVQRSAVFQKGNTNITKNLLQQKRRALQRKGYVANRAEPIAQDDIVNQQRKLLSCHLNSSNYAQKLSYLDDRKFYKTIKNQLKQLVEKIQTQKEIMISQVLVLKQDILSSFFAQIIQKTKKQCKQKGLLMHYIWNSMFSILQLAIKQMTKEKNHNQKQFLNQNLENHQKYQTMIDHEQKRVAQMKEQLQKAQVFNNTLVFNLRCKRRQLRKSYIKLKVCTNKLNEYKQSFLDLQRDHIDLLMETRDISKQMAQYLFKRRQQILQDKKKNYKLKFSKKANFAITKKQIQTQPTKDLDLINEQLKVAFSKQYEKELATNENKKIKKLTNFLFEEATDQFAFYENDDAIDDDIMASKMQTTFVDAQTDMNGFMFDVEDKQCQVDYIQKIVHGMVKNTAQQTMPLEQKVKKIFVEQFIQANATDLNQLKYEINNKVYDMSFLFEGKNIMNDSKKLTISKKKSIQDNRRSSINAYNQGSRLSINISSKNALQSKKRISRRISQMSQFSKRQIQKDQDSFEQHSESRVNIRAQQGEQWNEQSQQVNFVDYVSKFALRKGLSKKKKTGASLAVNKNDDNWYEDEINDSSQSGFVKTPKLSRFSSETKRISNSLNVTPSEFSKKTSFMNQNNDLQNGQKRKLKRQVISIRQRNSKSPQPSRFNELKNNSPMMSNVMKFFSKSIKDHTQRLDMNALEKIRLQHPGFQINEQMEEFIKIKQSQHKQKFFKNFSQSIAPLIADLYKNIEATKRYHKTLLPARHKNLCKIISNVYLHAYQLMDKTEKLYSLVNPLFKYFQIGYGMLKKYDLYSRMISFLSHVCIHKDESYLLYSFFFFTGIDKENPLSTRITAQDFQLYLKLLKSLSFNFTLTGFNVQNLFTSNLILQKNTKEVLTEEKLSQAIIQKVIYKVQQKLQKLTGTDLHTGHFQNQIANKFNITSANFSRTSPLNRSQSAWNTARTPKLTEQEQEIKLDVFKCCQLIMEEIISMRKCIEQSYLPLINHVYEQEQQLQDYRVDESLIQFIIRCQFRQKINQVKSYQLLHNIFKINTLYNEYKTNITVQRSTQMQQTSLKKIRTLKMIKFSLLENENENDNSNGNQQVQVLQKETLSLSQMCSFFLKANISDFNKTYYNALNIFKLREQAAFGMCIKRLPEIRKFFEKEDLKIELILLQQITDDSQLDLLISQSGQSASNTLNSSFYRTFNNQNALQSNNYQKDMSSGVTVTLKQIQNKKLLVLCFLRFLQSHVNQSVQDILGEDLSFLHSYMPMSKIKV